jgi:hypothetical protein
MRSPRVRGTARAVALAAAAGVSGVLFAQTVNLRPGNYEYTSTIDLQLPPQVAAQMGPNALAMMRQPHVTQHCIAASDLEHVSKNLDQGRNDQGCTMSERAVSGNSVKFTMQCPNGRSSHFEGTFMADSFQAVMISSGPQGQPVKVNISARRLGDCAK